PLNLWLLIPVAIVVSSLTAFFNPALRAFVPTLTEDRRLLETANGLMETTGRFARIIGPGLISVLSRLLPVVHYFTVDAISFFVSAWSISRVKVEKPVIHASAEKLSLRDHLFAGYRLVRGDSRLMYMVFCWAVVGALWLFIMPLGITLFLREKISS